tara:strand:+ start:126 stop:347 length:222 start_codon:yes stop_codon:yes gene_type:complete
MLKKQSIRKTHKIFLNNNKSTSEKDEIISLSESWTEKEEILFRKLLHQGGSVSIKGTHFKVVVAEKMRRLNEQ